MTYADDLRTIGARADLEVAAAREAAAAASAELAVALTRIRELEAAQPPVTPPKSGGEVLLWHNWWERPLMREYPADALTTLTDVVFCNMQSSAVGTGLLASSPMFQSAAEHKKDILALRAKGINVHVGVGGSGAGNITIANTTQVQQAYSSIMNAVEAYGVNGVNLDLEAGSSVWTEAALVDLATRLQAAAPGFLVSLTVQLYGEWTARWLSAGRALGARLHRFIPMLYDFPEARDSRFTAVVLDKCRTMAGGSIPQEKWIIGYMSRTAKDPSYNAGTPQVILDAHKAALAQYPGIKGVSIWQQKYEGLTGWELTRSIGAYVRSL